MLLVTRKTRRDIPDELVDGDGATCDAAACATDAAAGNDDSNGHAVPDDEARRT
jgi:hypothetical protein